MENKKLTTASGAPVADNHNVATAGRRGSGNYVWLAKIDKLNRVKEYLYSKTDTAERIRKLGWNASEEFFAFGNGILYGGTFKDVDDLGIVRGVNGKAFYIPATSKIYLHNPEIFQFERLMVHENRNGV